MKSKVIREYGPHDMTENPECGSGHSCLTGTNITVADWNFIQHYFIHVSSSPIGDEPEPIIAYIKNNLPDYVDTIINIGCSNGRDFIPFEDDYKLIGLDLAAPDVMEFSPKLNTDNLTYYQCSIEDYLYEFNHDDLDLSKALVYTSGVLLYTPQSVQIEVVNHLIKSGCKNMVFQEYTPDAPCNGDWGKFEPGSNIVNLFDMKSFWESPNGRDSTPLGHIILDENKQVPELYERFKKYKQGI